MKHIKLFEQFISEGASIFSDSTDKEITLKSEIELMNGQKAKVLAIPDKSNPKYKKGIIIVSAEKGGNQEIDINKDIKNVINEAEFVNEGKIGDKLMAKFTKETGIDLWDQVKFEGHPGKWLVTRLWAPGDMGGMNPGLHIELTKGNSTAHWMIMDDDGELHDSIKRLKKI